MTLSHCTAFSSTSSPDTLLHYFITHGLFLLRNLEIVAAFTSLLFVALHPLFPTFLRTRAAVTGTASDFQLEGRTSVSFARFTGTLRL